MALTGPGQVAAGLHSTANGTTTNKQGRVFLGSVRHEYTVLGP
jgi:hypothetical protein